MFGGQQILKPALLIRCFLRLIRQKLFGYPRKLCAERQQKQGCDNVKQCMYIGNLRRGIVRCERGHPLCKGGHQADQGKHSCANDIEYQVNQGGPFRVAVCPNRGQDCGDAGADILAEQDKDRAVQSD